MSKVYEALQHARAERDLVVPSEIGTALNSLLQEVVGIPGLSPLGMEKEMNRLHQSIRAILPPSKKVIVQFVGSRKNEGTSTIVSEFGRFLAERAGKYVLLVDGDHSQVSQQHHLFKHHSNCSLQDIVHEGESLERAISQVKNSRLFLTRLSTNRTSNHVTSVSMNDRSVWNRLRAEFDFTLVDSPPLSESDESLTLCSVVDGVVVVVEAERTRSQIVATTKSRVVQQGGTVLGLVFNKQRYYIPEWIYKRL
jgi:Mrp family chromosome partitioning ATPase